MTPSIPFTPAQAGTECLGNKGCGLSFVQIAPVVQRAKTWVPAYAGKSGLV